MCYIYRKEIWAIMLHSKIAIIHDSLNQRGGAERVVLALSKTFPNSDIITSVYDPEKTYPEFRNLKVLELLPKCARALPLSVLTPILPYLFRRAKLENYQLVIASTSAASHFASYKHANVIAYAHNTPRWLYQVRDFEIGLSLPMRFMSSALRSHYMKIDKKVASRVKIYFGNSRGTCKRIEDHYARTAILLNPPLMLVTPPSAKVTEFGVNYVLTVSRSRGYKNVQNVVNVAIALDLNLVIVGKNYEFESHGKPGQIRVVSDASDSELANIYRNAKLLICAAEEDFGLTPIEANYYGIPVVAPAEGGYLETVIHGKTGILAKSKSIEDLSLATRTALQYRFEKTELEAHASNFSLENFSKMLLFNLNARSK